MVRRGTESLTMGKTLDLTIIEASWHRNGISGIGFWAILFDDAERGRMVASLFEAEGYCAVYSIKELTENNIAFAKGNSWRGDVYAAALRPLLEVYLSEHGSNKFGPFSLF